MQQHGAIDVDRSTKDKEGMFALTWARRAAAAADLQVVRGGDRVCMGSSNIASCGA